MPIIRVQNKEYNNTSYESALLEMQEVSHSIIIDIMNETSINHLYESRDEKKESLITKIKKFFENIIKNIKKVFSLLRDKLFGNKKIIDIILEKAKQKYEKWANSRRESSKQLIIEKINNNILNDIDFEYIRESSIGDNLLDMISDKTNIEEYIESSLDRYYMDSLTKPLKSKYSENIIKNRDYTIDISDYMEKVKLNHKNTIDFNFSMSFFRTQISVFIDNTNNKINAYLDYITRDKNEEIKFINNITNIDSTEMNTIVKALIKIYDGFYNITNKGYIFQLKTANDIYIKVSEILLKVYKYFGTDDNNDEDYNESTVEINVDDLMYLVGI